MTSMAIGLLLSLALSVMGLGIWAGRGGHASDAVACCEAPLPQPVTLGVSGTTYAR